MGGAVSAGESNDDLVQNLVDAEYIKTAPVEKVFRAVDRADYYLLDHKESAYKDLAWKHNNYHLSAPCIYAEVMESLKLEPGMSFLNLGSGTGYLSTLAGLILGPYGVNHGVEYHADVIDYAKEKLDYFKREAIPFDEFDVCEPTFVQGNCLMFTPGGRLYDRVYCGAACPEDHENYMKNLIAVGGILVMPLNDQLLQITRTGETTWETKSVLPVSFASLLSPDKDKDRDIDLPETTVLTLQEICRISIRRILRKRILEENPNVGKFRPKKPRRTRREVRNRRRVNVVPMSMGMMILGNFDDSDSEDGPTRLDMEEDFPPPRRGEQGPLRMEDSEEEDDDEDRGDLDSEGAERSPKQGMPDMLQQMADMQRRFYQIARRERQRRVEEEEEGEEADMGIQEDLEERMPEDPATLVHNNEPSTVTAELSASSSSSEDMDAAPPSQSVSSAIPITASSHGRNRCSSSTSVSTSYTSGIGTCSSVEEQPDLDLVKEMSDHSPTIPEMPQDEESGIAACQAVTMARQAVDAPHPNQHSLHTPHPVNLVDNQAPPPLSSASCSDMENANQSDVGNEHVPKGSPSTRHHSNKYGNNDNGCANSNGHSVVQHFEDIIESDEEGEEEEDEYEEGVEEEGYEEERGRLCRPPCSLRREPPRLSIMKASEDMEERDADTEEEEEGLCEKEAVEAEEPQLHYKQFMKEKAEVLPIPVALRQYLLFYRS